jgi:hypothetical protein
MNVRFYWRASLACAALASVLTALASFAGCSDDAATGTVPSKDSGVDGPQPAETGPVDSGADAADGEPAECNNLTFLGQMVLSQFAAGDPPPPTGGTIVPGTYVLTGHTIFNGDGSVGPNGMTITKTAVFTSTTYQFIEAEGTVDGGITEMEHKNRTYTSDGGLIDQINVCPVGAPRANGYTVVGDTIKLYAPNDITEQVLTRK